MLKRYAYAALITLFFAAPAGWISESIAADIRKISREELRDMLGNPELIIIDVRTEKEWKKSELKIPGATWEDADEVKAWAGKYPKDKGIALYCS